MTSVSLYAAVIASGGVAVCNSIIDIKYALVTARSSLSVGVGCRQAFSSASWDQDPRLLIAARPPLLPGLLIAVALRYRYCSGATFTVAVAVAPLLLAESSAD